MAVCARSAFLLLLTACGVSDGTGGLGPNTDTGVESALDAGRDPGGPPIAAPAQDATAAAVGPQDAGASVVPRVDASSPASGPDGIPDAGADPSAELYDPAQF